MVNFSAKIRQVGEISVVEVTGKLTSLESGALRNCIAQLLKEGRKLILLNLSGWCTWTAPASATWCMPT
jgi:hypothetical protein